MLGVCYYPEQWPEEVWREDAAAMRAIGITFVRIGEFAWSRLEPEADRFEFGWLDRAIAVLGGAGLRVVLCTPTATPPKWLVDDHPDILPVDQQGRSRGFGSRRHSSFSSRTWWAQTRRITTVLAERYGTHEAIAGWQIDNEFGCHDTVLSYGPEDLAAFRDWLRDHYQDGDVIDAAWGNVFWSMEVRDINWVSLPSGAVTEINPAARLAYWRFSSEQVVRYGAMQADILRAHSPGRFVTHNYMGRSFDFDHWASASALDFATWDSYPLGFTQQAARDAVEKLPYLETGLPDIAAFHHDLYRGLGRGRFWVMEQQCGPVNWAPWNPVPKPGMVRLWTWEALAHGAEVVSYFRWRQVPFAQEQMHSGLHRPDRRRSPGGDEVHAVAQELAALGALPATTQAEVALIFDYTASWVTRIQPQGQDFDFTELMLRWYEALRRLGLDVDVVRPGSDLAGYRLVLIPCLPIIDAAAQDAISASDAIIVIGPRAGSKTPDLSIPPHLPPGEFRALLPITVTQVGSLPPGLRYPVGGHMSGSVERWREWIDVTGGETLAEFADGLPAVIHYERRIYIAGWPDADLRNEIMRFAAKEAGLPVFDLPEGVRLRRRGTLMFAFNYGAEIWTVPNLGQVDWLVGSAEIGPQQLACWRAEV